jgi:hypothetical protein
MIVGKSFRPFSSLMSRWALTMWPVVVIVSALWWARYRRIHPPSRRIPTVSSSPNRAISQDKTGRRLRSRLRFCAASIHLGKIKESSECQGTRREPWIGRSDC